MVECALAIGEARPLVKYQAQFLGDNNGFISLLHNQIVEYFQVFAEMVKVNLEKSACVRQEPEVNKSADQQDSVEVEMTDEKKIKGLVEQSLKEVTTVPLTSFTLLAVIDI